MSYAPKAVKPSNSRNWTTLGAGIFLLAMAAGMVIFAAENIMALAIGWFAFLGGLGLIMMAALDQHAKKDPAHSEAQKPVVRIRCTHCNSLNLDTSLRCANCGAKL